MNPKDRLIVALDVDTEIKALELVRKLKNDVKIFKIGLELFIRLFVFSGFFVAHLSNGFEAF